MMAGVVVLIFKNEFSLFKYCLVTISLFFAGFSLMRPERVVAEYNVKHVQEWSQGDFEYMTYRLSADAVPVVMKVLGDENGLIKKFYDSDEKSFYKGYYFREIWLEYDSIHKSFRSCNFSYEEAKRAMADDLKKYGLDDYVNCLEVVR